MTSTRALLAEYLQLRRSLGYKLVRPAALLDDFVSYLEGSATSHITVDAAIAWAVVPENPLSNWRAQRLGVVRCFARYCAAIDPFHEVPPPGLVPRRPGRPAPFIYSAEQVGALMRAARELRHPLRAATVEAVVGLLAVSGLRVAEVVRLEDRDLDFSEMTITVRESKAGKSRLLPLHPSALDALSGYATLRDQWCPWPKTAKFFVSSTGTALRTNNLGAAFAEVVSHAGLMYKGRRPRLGDFRHSFAVNTLISWHLSREDVSAKLPLLSAYLGHVNPASTYWYLSASPGLLAAAARRLEPGLGGRP